MESQVVNNSDVKNLQTLSMILDTYLENCIQNTDWENKANSQREKEKLYQKILKTINQIFSRIGVAAATLAMQPQLNPQEKQLNDAQVQQQDQINTNKNPNMETENAVNVNGQLNQNKVDQFYGNGQAQKLQDGQQDKNNMVQVNKNQMEDESGYCQKVVINAHPFKQRLINQQQRMQQELKQKNDQQSDEEDYDPPDNSSDSDFRSSDEEYSDKKKKLIHKKKHNNYFSYNSQNTSQTSSRPRGRPPSFANSENGTVSIQVAPVSEQKKILEYFNQHYDPQKRNKIYVINQITKQFNYSYSSVYYLVTKQVVTEEQEYHEQIQKHKQQQHRSSNQFQTQLQRQQMQQQQYYQNQFSQYSYKSEQFNNGYPRQGQSQSSQLHQSDMQKRNPSYYEQQRQQMRENKISPNDRFAQNLLNQPNSQPSYNTQNQQRRNPINQYSQQQGNYQNSNYQAQEMSQTDSDSGLFQNQAHNRQMYPKAEDELFRNDLKVESLQESRRVSEQGQDLQAKQIPGNQQNRLVSSENRQNLYGEYHRSASSRDTIQIQQKQE
ncbi:hypothetical protein TTHERM_00849260 (macronuclear) [Tetrahymena thermophila SB210]|uniref:Uncharacterized protein n=1 Tax=Tetrahymena thermophila (strain SB210) TaxID=312017 RepID=Q23R58_TETTS|nr:hypothetical protein TTHERM_00849260 [Tetrahymena thermophila SB210]EAR98983.4 hypothetical protein TTHERM_00849260 [Tetrahymena thermophila SB210]|eukprot:XP_001019228.4 hypothetical protein TTHERM_00849260 [Tetrahymena thermophila SB210]